MALDAKLTWRTLVWGVVLAATVAVRPGAAQHSLPAYNADIAETSVSGISSGAYMAVQFGTAWSSIVKGVGAVAGGPFGCSAGSAATALSTCMGGAPVVDLPSLIRRTDAWSASGAIDDTARIAAQKIYLFSGYNDRVVTRPVVDWLRAFYAHYLGANQGNLFYQTAIGAGHAQVTVGYGGDCNINGGVFINKCGYDQAGVILQHIYGALQPRNDGALTGQFLAFNQGDFTAPDRAAERSMDNTGFVYAPASCVAKEPCRVHVVLHGCLQSFNNISDNFIRNAGYNEWADTNRIIVLYPQIRAPSLARWGLWAPMMGGITNPQSCWDWWGYLDPNPMTSPTYLLKSGRQISAIKAMVDRLTGGLVAVTSPAVTPGAAPETVRVVDRTDTAIALVWSVVPGVARFEVFRADAEDAAFRLIGMVAGLSFADAELQAGTSYRYRVRALGGSALSAIASGATLPPVPRCDEPGRCAVR